MGFRLQLFFSPNPAKMTYLIFYKQLLESLHLSASLQMTVVLKQLKLSQLLQQMELHSTGEGKASFPRVSGKGP